VTSAVERYANGMSKDDAPAVRFSYLCWPAGLLPGEGGDAETLFDLVGDGRAADLDPSVVAAAVFRSATLPNCAGPSAWSDLWPSIERRLSRCGADREAVNTVEGSALRGNSGTKTPRPRCACTRTGCRTRHAKNS
jgi:hypothetical protein